MVFKKFPNVFFVTLKTSPFNPYSCAGVGCKRCCPSDVSTTGCRHRRSEKQVRRDIFDKKSE